MNKNYPFAHRTDWSLSTNCLTAVLNQLKKKNVPILDLTCSNPTQSGIIYPEDDILKPFNNKDNLVYQPTARGSLKTRQAIADDHQQKGFFIFPEQIFLTSSTSEAYNYLFRLLCEPHEHVLLPKPSYPLFQFLCDLNDLSTSFYFLRYANSWRIDVDDVKTKIRDDTKAIVLVNPNNPTGSYVQREELDSLIDFCRNRSIAIICDEVFWDYNFSDKKRLSLLNQKELLTFCLSGLSKTFGLPQMKLSWIVINGPEKDVQSALARLEVIADTFLSVNTPVQNALPMWLTAKFNIQMEILKRIRGNHSYLSKIISKDNNCQLLNVEGGWYAILKIPNTMSEEDWTVMFLKEDHVYVHPGFFFDFETEAYVILSLLPPESEFQEGTSRILNRIRTVIS